MTEKGFVERTEKDIVYIAAISAGCSGCKASCIGCGKKRIVKAVSDEKLDEGEEVLLITPDSTLYKLMLAVLLVPLVLLIVSYLLISPAFSAPRSRLTRLTTANDDIPSSLLIIIKPFFI